MLFQNYQKTLSNFRDRYSRFSDNEIRIDRNISSASAAPKENKTAQFGVKTLLVLSMKWEMARFMKLESPHNPKQS